MADKTNKEITESDKTLDVVTSKSVGAPSKYKEEYCTGIIEYFSVKTSTVNTMGNEEPSDFPSLAGYAIKIGVSKDTLLEWSKVHAEFSGPYKRAKDYQENWLLVNGNKGLIPPNFGIFTAKNVIGYRDKQPDEHDTFNINLTLADQMAKARLRVGKK